MRTSPPRMAHPGQSLLLVACLGLLGAVPTCPGETVAEYRGPAGLDRDEVPVEPPGMDITSVRAYRLDESTLVFRVEFRGDAQLNRHQIYLDVDGRAQGEEITGADYLFEGLTWHKHLGGIGWMWKPIGTPPVFMERHNQLTFVLPSIAPFEEGAWCVQSIGPDWAPVDRVPNEGVVSFSSKDLPAIRTSDLSPEVTNPALDIVSVKPYRLAEGGLAFRIAFAGKPEIPRLRLMLDTDPDGASGFAGTFDNMVEGYTLYTYPEEAGGAWAWTATAPAAFIEDSNTLICCLLEMPPLDRVRWHIETTTPDWALADRQPLVGTFDFSYAALPLLTDARFPKPGPEDVSELLAHMPRTLSVRFDEEAGQAAWQPADPAQPALAWQPAFMGSPLPLALRITDIVNGGTESMVPEEVLADGGSLRLSGSTLGVAWTVILTRDKAGNITLTGQLEDDADRCLNLWAGLELDLAGWTWHDDVRFSRAIEPGMDLYVNAMSTPYGVRGEQSRYFFGVITSPQGTLIAETDPTEPRVVQILADPGPRFFGLSYDLALTPRTAKFPGRATFQCSFRSASDSGGHAFRQALADFYGRYPACFERRAPRAGLWMPFYDISKLPQPQDFGFGFYEKGGPLGKDVDYCKANNILTLIYTEPWLYWLPMAAGASRTEAEALKQMKFRAATGDKEPNEWAAAALLGAARRPDGTLAMEFLDTPWNSGGRMEVNTDPELPTTPEAPINRAMSAWRFIRSVLDDPRVDGIYLDSMSAMQILDYNPRAMAVADYPCTFDMEDRKPGLSTKIVACELTACLGGYLRDHGKYLMANFPHDLPFFMQHIDIPGQETPWFIEGGHYPLPDQQLNYIRAVSGQKPWGFLQANKFDTITPDLMERYFLECMFWAFQPSFFSYDGANEPYWTNTGWMERDRPLFKTYVPLSRRLAEAGWQPVGPARSSSDHVWIEHFGDAKAPVRHITLRNTTRAPLVANLTVDGLAGPTILLDPLTARADWIEPGQESIELDLAPSQIAARDIVTTEGLAAELEFVQSWNSGSGEGRACFDSLSSIRSELAAGARCSVSHPAAAVYGGANPFSVSIRNEGDTPLSVVNASLQSKPLTTESPTAAPGETCTLAGSFPGDDLRNGRWLTAAWDIVRGDVTTSCKRVFRPRVKEPVEVVAGLDRIVAVGHDAVIPLTIINYSRQLQPVRVKHSGDFVGGGVEGELVPLEVRQVALTVPQPGAPRGPGAMKVSVDSSGKVLFERDFPVTFLPAGDSLVRDTRVTMEVDSTFYGYRADPLADGVTDITDVPWDKAAWASQETAAGHWVRFAFPEPTTVREMAIYWNSERGVTYTSARGAVRATKANGEKLVLGEFVTAPDAPVTRVLFEPVEVVAIELYQPPRSGHKERENLMWLVEVEVR